MELSLTVPHACVPPGKSLTQLFVGRGEGEGSRNHQHDAQGRPGQWALSRRQLALHVRGTDPGPGVQVVGTTQLLPGPSRLCRIPCCHPALLPWGSRHKELQPNLWLGDKGPLPAPSQGGPRTPHHLSARPAGLRLRDRGPDRTVQAAPHRSQAPSVRSTHPHGPGAGVGPGTWTLAELTWREH